MENITLRKNALLDALSQEGIRVLEIWHPSTPEDRRFYETGDFRHANNEIHKHSLSRCKDITQIIDQQKSIFTNVVDDIRAVGDAINNQIRTVNKEFHKDFLWIWHT